METIVKKIFNLVEERKISKEDAKEMIKALQSQSLQSDPDVAVIGMAGKFPQADNIAEFWENLVNGRNCISVFPETRRKDTDPIVKAISGRDVIDPAKIYKTGGYLKETALFDAGFFRLSPREAMVMEPAQRLFLQTAWEAIEDAGLAGEQLVGSNTGVFVGRDHSTDSTYKKLLPEMDALVATGSWTGILASRISYIFDFQGPSIVIDTACSSGLVAVHEACKALQNKECDLAIAGGVFIEIMATQGSGRLSMVESSDYTIRSFDKYANGTIWGEGVGAVLLKPLKKALADGDSIHAIIRGSAINNDGASNGITAPKAEAQEQVILRAWKNARVNPETITYIETHGTGTILGDPIEVKGLTSAFRHYTEKKQFCGIGSCKTNIGHLVAASGIASFIKIVLCVKHGIIPASLNFQEPNPYIEFSESPVYVHDRLQEWKSEGIPRRGGISAYGFSGTNCHMVIEEAPAQDQTPIETQPQVVGISARSKEILEIFVQNYHQWVEEHPVMNLADFCYTINTGRGHFTYRLALIVSDRNELAAKLARIKEMGLHHDPAAQIFYGEHKVVNASKQNRDPGEMTEGERRDLSKMGARRLQELAQTGQGIDQLAEVYIQGAELNWAMLYEGKKRRRLHLPTYPFEQTRFWPQNPKFAQNIDAKPVVAKPGKEIAHPLLDRCIAETINQEIYVTSFSVERHWVLQDHRVLGNSVVPGTTYIELIREAVKKYYPDWGFELSDFYFMTPLMVNGGEEREVQTVLQRRDGSIEFTIASKDELSEDWTIHAQGKIIPSTKPDMMHYDLEMLKARFSRFFEVEPKEVKGAFELGPRWANFRRVFVGDNEVLVFISIQDQFRDDLKEFFIHPALMDLAVNAFSQSLGDGMYLPFNYKSLKLFGRMPEKFYSYMRKIDKQTESTEMFSANITLMDEAGQVFAEITDYKVKKLRASDLKVKKNLYHSVNWCEKPLLDGNTRSLKNQKALIIHDETRMGHLLAAQLRAQGCTIFEASFATNSTDAGNGRFTMTGSEDDLINIFTQLKDQGLSMILHLGTLTEHSNAEDLGDLMEFQKRGVKSLFSIMRAVSKAKIKDSLELILVTEGVSPAPGTTVIYPHNASMVGFGKIIGQEMQNLRVRVIDLEPLAQRFDYSDPQGTKDRTADTQTVIREILTPNPPYQISYRAGKRYVEEIERCKLDEQPAIEREIHSDGVYLITGGTGGIGLEVAKYLASRNKVNLALLNRTPLPLRSNWEEIIESGDDEKLCTKLKAIREIEATGATVAAYPVNVDSLEEMQILIAQLHQQFGQIHGVVHAAGVAGDGFILRKDEAVFDGVLAPKIQGTWILDQLTRTDCPDFFVLCSSISTLMAGAGQGDYVAANAYLDAYAQYRSQAGYPTVSINWAAWKETGMAVNYQVNTEGGIFKGLTTLQAMNALEEVLEREISRIVVGELNYQHNIFADVERFPIQLSAEIKEAIIKTRRRLQAAKPVTPTEIKRKDVKLKGRADGKYTAVEKDLASIWGEVLVLDEVDIYEDFYALGGDSIIAIKLTNAIKSLAGIKVDTSDIFEHQSIADFAAYLEREHSVSAGEQAAAVQVIETEEQATIFPLSNTQQRIWFLQQYASGMTAYNLPGIFKIKKAIDLDALQKAVNIILERHSALRTIFVENEGIPQQIVLPRVEIPLEVIDLRREADPEAMFVQCVRKDNLDVFDMTQPLMKIKVYLTNDAETNIYLNIHHIITDGWSMGIITQELIYLYKSITEGQAFTLPPMTVRYEDWLKEQDEWLRSSKCQEAEKYWLQEIQKPLPVLNLPTDFPRPLEKSYNGTFLHRRIDTDLTRQLKEVVKEQGTTLHMFFISAYFLLLQKLTQDDDIIVGVPIAGRDRLELEQVVGLFINMLPLRVQFGSLRRFTDLLGVVKEKSMRAYKYSKYPFDLLVNRLNPDRDPSRSPIFSTVFQFFTMIPYAQDGVALYDLSMDCREEDGEIAMKLEYCTDLFTSVTMERFASSFLQVLQQIQANPEIELSEIQVLSEAERRKLLEEFNATGMDYPQEKTLHELFEEQVAKNPEQVALVFGEEQMTYAELNANANQLAYRLRELGVERDEIVGIMAERSNAMIVGIMGVLKAGGAYMPIDPDYPVDRIQYMLEDSEAHILLTLHDYRRRIPFTDVEILLLDEIINNRTNPTMMSREVDPMHSSATEQISSHFSPNVGDHGNLANINKPADLAYVMYTSGSTGKPKGVMIEHRSVVNLSTYYNTLFHLDQQKHILHMSNVSFDTSVVEIFPPLMYGSTIYIIRKELALDREGLLAMMEQNQIHFAQFVPMTLQEILSNHVKPSSLESVIVGGDKLDDVLKDQILALGYRLTNHYGPTESTVDAIVAVCEPGKTTIGKPIANMRVYILGKDGQPTPIGVPGELCISGVGLARGYLKRLDLTEEKFVPNPWVTGERMYRTGDLASWQSDGSITFHGRIDNQVKIRGYRIEPQEIEDQLLQMEGITGAVVIDHVDQGGSKYLCAYYVANREMTVAELRAHLALELPDYMIPSYFVQMEQIPLTYNGKVDRRALPQPDGEIHTGVEHVAPTNALEGKLVELWQEVLGVDQIGIQHNFFEMGGHSLKAMMLVSKIQKEFQVKVPYSELFKHPTVQKLARYLERAEQNQYTTIQPVEAREYYPLSSAQRRIYIQWQLAAQSKAYNMTSALILEGDLNRDRVAHAIRGLMERHEALRTSFVIVDGEPMQTIHQSIPMALDYREVQEEALPGLVDQFVQSYDLSKAPLFRMMLVRFAEKKHLLLFDMHHIISDGLSMSILTRDFASLYAGNDLAPLRVQYKDYAVWHNALMESPTIERWSDYWMNKLNGFTYTELPANIISYGERPEGRILHARLDQALTRRIQLFCQRHQMTQFAFVFGVFKLILMQTIQQDDLTVGIPVAGRSQEEMEQMIGVFLNVLTIRTQVDKEITFHEYLSKVSHDLMEAQEHQDYPYETLYAKAKEMWNFRHNSLFSILFNYMPYEGDTESKLDGITIRPYPSKEMEPKYPLTLYVNEGSDRIGLTAVFQSNLDAKLIEIILNSFPTIIDVVLDQEDVLIKEIALTGDHSSEQYSEDFAMEFDNDEFF